MVPDKATHRYEDSEEEAYDDEEGDEEDEDDEDAGDDENAEDDKPAGMLPRALYLLDLLLTVPLSSSQSQEAKDRKGRRS